MKRAGSEIARRLRLFTASARWLSAVGVLAAAVLTVSVNVLGHRWSRRWDVTSTGAYTLSPVTLETLRGLDAPLDVVVFLSESDSLTASVRLMLEAYQSHTPWLHPRFVDPDRQPAEFVALQNELGIFEGASENGKLKNSASIVIARDKAHWFISSSDLVAYDESAGRSQSKLEQVLTLGIRNVIQKKETHVCFSSGHQELSSDNGGPQGLGALKASLERNNFRSRNVDLSDSAKTSLEGCEVVIVAGPRLPFSTEGAKKLLDYFEHGGNLLLSLDPILDADGQAQKSGFESLLARAGIELGGDVVLETVSGLVVPVGIGGEAFFATPKLHDVTRGLLAVNDVKFRVMLQMAQSVRPKPDGSAVPLLVSSGEARSLRDLRSFAERGLAADAVTTAPRAEYTVAAATELAGTSNPVAHGPRLVVLGASTPLWGESFRQPALYGSRLFSESTVSWLGATPLLVSVPEKPVNEASLSLTEESLSQVQRYVLLYMPGTALLLGVLVLLRRRGTERAARATDEEVG